MRGGRYLMMMILSILQLLALANLVDSFFIRVVGGGQTPTTACYLQLAPLTAGNTFNGGQRSNNYFRRKS
jgi:hypothetical protein